MNTIFVYVKISKFGNDKRNYFYIDFEQEKVKDFHLKKRPSKWQKNFSMRKFNFEKKEEEEEEEERFLLSLLGWEILLIEENSSGK